MGKMEALSIEHAYFDLEYFLTKIKLVGVHYTVHDHDGNVLFKVSPTFKKLKISDFELIEDEA